MIDRHPDRQVASDIKDRTYWYAWRRADKKTVSCTQRAGCRIKTPFTLFLRPRFRNFGMFNDSRVRHPNIYGFAIDSAEIRFLRINYSATNCSDYLGRRF